ncbi:MAG: AarF/UbiB family protein [Methylococcaceae bacterium]|nr:AarF/UbiB family protein [Methylococcaceae bacterium]MCI0666603.1 AarF/UbiB family protein [Methylococcaceae bacterium]MCI0734318.1 AarF/UbiB family protein [Methylococcaceae bacterium]
MLWEALSAVRDIGRLHDLASVLIRYGFGDIVRRIGMGHVLERTGKALHWKYAEDLTLFEPPQRVRRALEEMGPTFIKLGQVLATRVDLFPPEWIREFEKLQDQVPSLPYEDLAKQVEEDLGAPIEEIFPSFEKEPLAAASIAQVHRARLDNGDPVIVKIRRPNIRRVVEADLRLMERLAKVAESELTELQRYHPQEVIRQFTLSLHRELDFATESRNAERMARNFADNPSIVIPKMYWEWVGERINVQEYVEGIPARHHDTLVAAGLDCKRLAQRGADAVLKMVLIDGFFHADPHPGNLIFLQDDRIAFIDFGMTGWLSESRRDQIVGVLHALVNRDSTRVVDVLQEWAGDTYIETAIVISEIDRFIDTYHSLPLKQLDVAAMLSDLTSLIRNHELSLPPDLTMLFKALITLDGTGRQIDPDFDLVGQAAPFLEKAMLARYRPDEIAKRSWRSVIGLSDLVTAIPQDLRRLLRALRSGALKINVDMTRLNHFGLQLDRAASRLTVGMITSALIIGSSIVMTVSGGPTLFGLPAFGLLGFLSAGVGGMWLMVSIWKGGHDKG